MGIDRRVWRDSKTLKVRYNGKVVLYNRGVDRTVNKGRKSAAKTASAAWSTLVEIQFATGTTLYNKNLVCTETTRNAQKAMFKNALDLHLTRLQTVFTANHKSCNKLVNPHPNSPLNFASVPSSFILPPQTRRHPSPVSPSHPNRSSLPSRQSGPLIHRPSGRTIPPKMSHIKRRAHLTPTIRITIPGELRRANALVACAAAYALVTLSVGIRIVDGIGVREAGTAISQVWVVCPV